MYNPENFEPIKKYLVGIDYILMKKIL